MIDLGDVLPGLTITTLNTAGVAANAASVTLTITLPDAATTTPSVTNTVTGVYTATYTTTQAGRHVAKWTATAITGGPAVAVYEQTWDVADTSRSIIGLDETKTFLRITGTGSDDELRDVIEAASDLCERHTRKTWRRSTVTAELHDGGASILYLRRSPVVSVTTVTDQGLTVAPTLYTLDTVSGRLFYGDTISPGIWSPGQDNVSVTYVTGPPGGIVPGYIRRGLLILIQHLWDTQRGGSNLPRKSGGLEEYDRRASFTLPRRVLEMWGEPTPLVR